MYNKKKLSGLFMFVDFEKAFDSIEWAFLFRTLAKCNLGCDFQQWAKLLYTSPYASVKNNGYSSSEFCFLRGVRQGCQVSALISILIKQVIVYLSVCLSVCLFVCLFGYGRPNRKA